MTVICSILIALAWLTPAIAGSINFSFELRDKQCVVVNRGDSSAYYPVIFQLGRDGQWIAQKSGSPPAELPPGGTLSAGLRSDTSALPAPLDIDRLHPVMIRFFDKAGVSFGQVSLLRSPPESAYTLKAEYSDGRLRITAPADKSKIQATWVIAPFEEGIAPIFRPLTFTHRQPPATRIEWNQKTSAEVETGAARPAAFLVHETPDGFSLQKVTYSSAKKVEQRTAWLNMKRQFYVMALLFGIGGILLLLCMCRVDRSCSPSPPGA